jgi:hypothetical protein
VIGTKLRIFSPLPRDVSLEELVPEADFYRRWEERLDLSFVREVVEDHANPSFLGLMRLPTRKGVAEPYFLPQDGWLPRWWVPSTTIDFSTQCSKDLKRRHPMRTRQLHRKERG